MSVDIVGVCQLIVYIYCPTGPIARRGIIIILVSWFVETSVQCANKIWLKILGMFILPML